MYIEKETIQDIDDEFEVFFDDMEGVNYVIAHYEILFSFSNGSNFSIKDLSSLVKAWWPTGIQAEGLINNISFQEVEKKINRCLTFNPYSFAEKLPQEKAEYLIKTYWDLVKKYFATPTTVCYQHDPSRGSCFDFGIMWNFCFILLNAQGQGIILHAGAAD